ncbi:hypothetical protein L355_07573 [Enterobacter sp. MGH 9]|nr:hypothetical protein L354_00081 [Enterobacter sp. MGH 8]ESN16599.1 hypothetical protein L372_00287 [Enterobacter sp. MGH 26]EUM28642.1 hypothetical protein L407_04143 [Enterobacter sp. BWH 39]EUM63012.1 hypothetical protein L358_02784 [Enterobacter sp. MGH 12]EUM73071.1 hypothetical protein L355_07573 [Enterobacter sp. MGH 9]EUM91682.1 hypothetical protein L351_07583 [Enterobacter sp. MGH 5]KDM52839.1 hypothetical protein AF34_02383 [Enterobacter hormaechei subsp. hoffmannii]KLW48812.1 hy
MEIIFVVDGDLESGDCIKEMHYPSRSIRVSPSTIDS